MKLGRVIAGDDSAVEGGFVFGFSVVEENILKLGRVIAGDDSAVEGCFVFGFSDRKNTRTSSHSMPGTNVKSMRALSSISLKVKRV